MRCERAQALSSEYVDGRLAPRRASALEDHFQSCSACRRALADFQRMKQLLAKADPPGPGANFWDRALSRARSGAPGLSRRPTRWLPQWSRVAGWATAAAAAALVVAAPIRIQQWQRPIPSNIQHVLAWHATYCLRQPLADHGQLRLVATRAQLSDQE